MDFTLTTYKRLLTAFKSAGYTFQTFQDFLKAPASRVVIMRHDVDERPQNALKMARVEHEMGIRASYYFRILKISNAPAVIAEIARMGHEIGYHYEDLALAGGDVAAAIERFADHLAYFRMFYPVETICMHGSPTSPHDNRRLWQTGNYRDYGIIGEPYFDIDFDQVFYLTDTGRRWDGWQASIRDKMPQQADWSRRGLVFHATADIISAAEEEKLPNQIMITVHPQRWSDRRWPWAKELVLQRAKNIIKAGFVIAKGENAENKELCPGSGAEQCRALPDDQSHGALVRGGQRPGRPRARTTCKGQGRGGAEQGVGGPGIGRNGARHG